MHKRSPGFSVNVAFAINSLYTHHPLQLGLYFVHISSVAFPVPVSLPLQKCCLSKYPWGKAGQPFNTLQPPEDRASDINGVVNHRDWITVTLTQLSSFLFPLIYPFPRDGSLSLTMVGYLSGWGSLSTWTFFSSL